MTGLSGPNFRKPESSSSKDKTFGEEHRFKFRINAFPHPSWNGFMMVDNEKEVKIGLNSLCTTSDCTFLH